MLGLFLLACSLDNQFGGFLTEVVERPETLGDTMKKSIGAAAAALLFLMSVAVPLSAQGVEVSGHTVFKGHVRGTDGQPLAGIKVEGGVATDDEDGSLPDDIYVTTKTDKNGRYEMRVARFPGTTMTMNFSDPDNEYAAKFKEPFAPKAGRSYRIDRTLAVTGEIAGTVRDADGNPIKSAKVTPWDVAARKYVGQGVYTNKAGRYHLVVPRGTYKLKVSDPKNASTAEWFSDASRDTAQEFAVVGGSKAAGTNVTLE
jgi:hypothetical protein